MNNNDNILKKYWLALDPNPDDVPVGADGDDDSGEDGGAGGAEGDDWLDD